MTLLDTSVWIQVFRQRNPLDLEAVVPFEEVVVCLPVIQEILQGFRDEQAFRVARDSLLAMPCVESPLDQDVFLEATDLYRRARRAGLTVRFRRRLPDCSLRHPQRSHRASPGS